MKSFIKKYAYLTVLALFVSLFLGSVTYARINNPPPASSGGVTSLNGLTGATQTFTNDTNVTIASAGTAHVIGWSGSAATTRGGMGTTTWQTNSVPYFNGTRMTENTGLTFDGTTLTATNLIFTNATGTSATTTNLAVSGTFANSGTATSTFTGGISTTRLSTSATSTGSKGWDITDGCFSVNGTCVGSSGAGPSLTAANTFSGANTFTVATTTLAATSTSPNGIPHFNNGNFATTTAGGTINGYTLPVPVSIATTTKRVVAMDGNDITTMDNFLGFAVTNGTDGTEIVVQTDGIVNGFSGLTIGRRYYVQDAVGTIGTTMGTYDFYVGIAASTTALLIDRSEGGNQYIGSVAFAQTAADTLSCVMSATVSPLARSFILQINLTDTNLASGATIPFMRSVSSDVNMDTNVSSAQGATQFSTAMSGSVITTTIATANNGGATDACSGTVYMYR